MSNPLSTASETTPRQNPMPLKEALATMPDGNVTFEMDPSGPALIHSDKAPALKIVLMPMRV